MNARFPSLLVALCLTVAAIAGGFASRPESVRAPASADQAQAASAAAPSAAAAASADAAAKHTKRTACLQNAKARKLLGAERTAFLKTCMAAP
jgi:hypothetical protein